MGSFKPSDRYYVLSVGILLITSSVIVIICFDYHLFVPKFICSVMLSLGSGIVAALIPGRIRDSSNLGPFNIRTASGGMAVFLVVFYGFHYFSGKDSSPYYSTNKDVEKYFQLLGDADIRFNVVLIDTADSKIELDHLELYKVVEMIRIPNANLQIDFNLEKHRGSIETVKLIFSDETLSKFEPALQQAPGWSAINEGNQKVFLHSISKTNFQFSFNTSLNVD